MLDMRYEGFLGLLPLPLPLLLLAITLATKGRWMSPVVSSCLVVSAGQSLPEGLV